MNKIDKYYYINLDRRPDRNQHFLYQCSKEHLPMNKVVRYTALDGLKYNFSKEEIQMFDKVDYKGRPFESKIMGNQLSHYYILEEMIKNNYNYIVIFQDDIILKNNFLNYFNKLMENIPDNAEIINFGFHKYAAYEHFVPWNLESTYDYNDLGKLKINSEVCLLQDTINPCSLAYIVTLKGAKNLTAYFKKNGFLRATDWNYNDYLRAKNINYGINTVLCTGNPYLGSDIFT